MDRAAERRLAAIMITDVVGYSRMISVDEEGTLRRYKQLRREVIDPRIAAAHGRIIKSTGDGVMVEFPSSVRAVTCAVAIQRAAAVHNAALPDGQALHMRIGINLGDVIADPDGDLYGDGVNVAARLEPLAEPGGLCISRSIHDQVRDRLPYRFEDKGKLPLKNIARPIGVFAFSSAAIAAAPEPPEEIAFSNGGEADPVASRQRMLLAVAASVFALCAAGSGLTWWTWSAKAPTADHTLAVQAGLPAKPLPPLSLVVLPFSNLSSDPEQEFFADGLTEDLTTDVSHLAGSFVIARNTAFTYKGKSADVKQIGRDLGVRYALEGSVRRTGEQVVVNAQLISTETGAHIWADRFEGDRSRLGELQVEFVARLARSLDVQLTQAESLRTLRERPNNPDAADLSMRGWAELNKPRSPETNNKAIDLFNQSLKLDVDNSSALSGLARATITKLGMAWSTNKEQDIKDADTLIDKYLSKNPNDAIGQVIKGDVLRASKKFDDALGMYDASISNNRNYALAYALKGHISTLTGKAAQATPNEFYAIRLSPRDPLISQWYYFVCHSYVHQQKWEDAIPWCSKSVSLAPYWLAQIDLAASYAWTGKNQEARDAVDKILKLMPGYTVQKWANAGWSDNPKFLEEYTYLVEGLRKAGLPED